MPKMKTHKGSQKRFRVTASGKLKRAQAGKKHLNSPKTAKRKSQLRKPFVTDQKIARKYVKHLGGEN
jgi:large subunit ribosomal protein L35